MGGSGKICKEFNLNPLVVKNVSLNNNINNKGIGSKFGSIKIHFKKY